MTQTTQIDEFGATDSRFCAAILGYSFKLDDYGTEVLVAPSVSTRSRINASRAPASTPARDAIVTVLVDCPKTPGKKNYDRWMAGYKTGRTVAETITAGCTMGDIVYDRDHGFIRVDAIN